MKTPAVQPQVAIAVPASNGSRLLGRLFLLGVLAAGACAPLNLGSTPISALSTSPAATAVPPPASAPTAVPTASPGTAVVAFIQNGNIQVWEEATGQTETIFASGEAIELTVNDDGQVVAFLRRSIVGDLNSEWHEQSALWAVDRDGGNPRELVSAEQLREQLSAAETDSTNIPQMAWIPGTHRLLYSGWTYFVQAEGESHAVPEGLYLVDADTPAHSVLVPAGNPLRFAPAPDGQHVALITLTGLRFLGLPEGDRREGALSYTQIGLLGPLYPSGVWTQDSRAFLITGSLAASPNTNVDFTIWSVPVDGSPAQPLAAVTGSIPDSVTFSPNGRSAAVFQSGALGPGGAATDYGWFVIPLAGEVGALAAASSAHMSWQNLHWSPGGTAYAVLDGSLFQLCPDAAQESEVCGEVLYLGDPIANIRWIDGNRFLWVTREPYDLYFGKLDGTRIRLAEGAERFAAVAMTCGNDAELVAEGAGLAQLQAAPKTLFPVTWQFRNTGTCTWDPSYRLGFLSGDRMSGPRSLSLEGTIAPGEEIELSVRLIAPGTAGTYQGRWQLFAPDGSPFGVAASADIVVPFDKATELTPGQIAARVSMDVAPSRVAVGEGAAWVTHEYGTLVSRIDLETNQLVATVQVGNLPRAVVVGFGSVWVANLSDGTISRIDPATNRVSATIPLDPSPREFGAVPLGVAVGAGAVWVASGVTGAESGSVARIDPATNQVVASITVERWPWQVAATEDAIWTTHTVNPILTRIDPATNQVAATIELDCPTMGLAADSSAVWAACASGPVLYRIDPRTNQVVARLAVGHRSEAIALGPNAVWVASAGDSVLISIDPETNQAARIYSVGQGPTGLAAIEDELWLAMSGEDTVWRIRP